MKWWTKLLAMCLVCTLSALSFEAIFFLRTSSQILYDRVKDEIVNSLENMQNEVYLYLNNMENNLIDIYEKNALVNALNSGIDIDELRNQFLGVAVDLATSSFETNDKVVALYIYNADHEIISTYRRTVTPKHNYPVNIYDSADFNGQIIRDFVESPRTDMLISGYYNNSRQTDILHLVLKIYAGYRYDHAVGYVVCDIDSQVIRSIMEKYRTDSNVLMWLQPLSDSALVTIGLKEGNTQTFEQISGKVAQGSPIEEESEEGARTEFFHMEQKRYNLTAFSLMPQEILHQNQAALTKSLVMIASVMIVVTLLVTSFVFHSMMRPVRHLTETIGLISAGQTHCRVSIISNDEIGQLSTLVNEMLDRLEVFRRKEQEHDRLLNQAKYKALQAQINPHFLYNTLETMASIADMESCTQVSELSYALSKVFRYSLNMRDPAATVEQELEHLRYYTHIMDVRMNHEVEYTYDIDPAVLGILIPRLSLQPLVENAINHGLKNSTRAKKIHICGKLDGDTLLLSVEDNGLGMEPETIAQILDGSDLTRAEKGDSIGLNNINARLKLLSGSPCGLKIDSQLGKGTKVTLSITWKKMERMYGKV